MGEKQKGKEWNVKGKEQLKALKAEYCITFLYIRLSSACQCSLLPLKLIINYFSQTLQAPSHRSKIS